MLEFSGSQRIAKAVSRAGGRSFIVGGFVRDRLLGVKSKDIDIEVHGLEASKLVEVLRPLGKVDEVGKSFGVLKLRIGPNEFDVSLPRTDSKTGEGHTGFDVRVDPHMGIIQALMRRDFTINALAVDILKGEIIDPFGGLLDLQLSRLRAVSGAFSEDPLRVLRGVQFAGRFGMTIEPKTAQMCRDLLPEIDSLSIERVWGEWEKIGRKGVDLDAVAAAIEATGLQGKFGTIIPAAPDLEGLSGDRRTAVVLTALGVDPRAIGATKAVTRRMDELARGLAFSGSPAESRAFARTMKVSTFSDVKRINFFAEFALEVIAGPVPPILSGADLIELGVEPGPELGALLRDVTRAQDFDEFCTREGAISWVKERIAV